MIKQDVTPETNCAQSEPTVLPKRVLLGALLVGAVWHVLWWSLPPVGINALLGTGLAWLLWWFFLRGYGPLPVGTRALGMLSILWAALPVWRSYPALTFFAWWAWLMTLFLALPRYFPGDAWRATFWGWMRMVGAWLGALIPDVLRLLLLTESRERFFIRYGRAIGLGLALLLPLGLCFGGLLASADPIFEHYFVQLLSWNAWWEVLGRLLVIGLFAWLWLAGLLVAWHSRETSRESTEGPSFEYLPWVSSAVVFGGLLLLFGFFLVLQARYLFGGHVALQTFDLTYAQYARRGFGELVVVAVLFLGVLITADAFTARPNPRAEAVFRGFAWATLVAVSLMLASAAYRLGLYIQAFGLTSTRLQVAVFMFWLLVALILAAWTVRRPKPHPWPLVILLPYFGFVLTLAVMNPASWVVRVNVWRSRQGHELDIPYLIKEGELGPEVWVALEAVYRDPGALSERTRHELGAAIACVAVFDEVRASMTEDEASQSDVDWRGWSWGRWRGRAAYRRLVDDVRENFPVRVYEDRDSAGTWQRFQVRVNGDWRSCYDMSGIMDIYRYSED